MRQYCEHCLQPYDSTSLANRIIWLMRKDPTAIFYQAVITAQLGYPKSKAKVVLQALASLENRGFVERATAPYIPEGSYGWRLTVPLESPITDEQIEEFATRYLEEHGK